MGRIKMVLYSSVVILLMSQCNLQDLEVDKIAPLELSPLLAVRVGEKTVSVSELIDEIQSDEIEILTDDELLIHFVLKQEIDFGETQDVISIMSVTNSEELQLPIDTPPLPFEQEVPFEKTFEFEFAGEGNERIDSVFFKGGRLEYEMVSEFAASVDYSWTIINTKEISTNLDISQSAFLEYNGTQISDSYSRSLVGLKSIIERIGDLNLFQVDLSGNLIVPAGQGISSSQKFQFDLTYQDPEFRAIYGYFSQQELAIDETEFELGAFDEYASDGLYFADPSITLEITNSFGIDILLDFDGIRGENGGKPGTTLITNIPEVDRMIKSPSLIDSEETTTIVIDNDVSNLGELLSSFPEKVIFNVSAEMNPDISSLESNFIADNSAIKIAATVDIPLQVRLEEFEVEFEIDSVRLDDLEGMNSLAIQIIATNEIPFTGSISLAFDDVVTENSFLIESPEVTANGRVLEPKVTTSTVSLVDTEIDALLTASKIVATVNISTFNADQDESIKIFSDYELKLAIGILGEVVVEL
ncbi:MAG: hypothetical protein JXR07_05185 [Reichenbachiella sp.]